MVSRLGPLSQLPGGLRDEISKIYVQQCFPDDFRFKLDKHIPYLRSLSGKELDLGELLRQLISSEYAGTAFENFYSLNKRPFTNKFESCIGRELFMVQQSMPKQPSYNDMAKELQNLKRYCKTIRMSIGCWKRYQQQLANSFQDGIGQQTSESKLPRYYWNELTTIRKRLQTSASKLYELLDEAYRRAQQGPQYGSKFLELQNKTAQAIGELLKISLIVTQQPKQVLVKGSSFNVSVTLLGGLRERIPNLRVGCVVRSEDQLPATDADAGNSEFDLSTTEAFFAKPRTEQSQQMEGQENEALLTQLGEAYHARFIGVHLNKIIGERRKKCDKKYALLFKTQLQVVALDADGNRVVLHEVSVRCRSLPIVCLVNSSQEARARGTIFWNNAFSSFVRTQRCECRLDKNDTGERRELNDYEQLFGNNGVGVHYCQEAYEEPETVGWPVFINELNKLMEALTGRQFDETGKNFICRCVAEQVGQELHVSRNRVMVDPIADPIRRESFWLWLYGLIKLVSDSAVPLVGYLWRNGYIHFLKDNDGKNKIVSLAQRHNVNPADIMLFRFCNSEDVVKDGAIVMTHGVISSLQPESLEPWGAKELQNPKLEARRLLLRPKVVSVSEALDSWDELLERSEIPTDTSRRPLKVGRSGYNTVQAQSLTSSQAEQLVRPCADLMDVEPAVIPAQPPIQDIT